ncbi:MAG: phytanoyl-CoA dioxygenase family protein [Candidatus Latescibacteria bacterium]|nr:phytanoyl-CoA dioxygenase family protein [Candidatus Latescibacterota bacterium]
MLTEKQIHYFNTFGFVILRQVFTQDELQTINAEYKHRLETAYQHAPFDGTQRHWVPMLESDTPFFANLLEDPRFYEVAEQLYGKDVFGIASDANRYVGDTKWHPDTRSAHQYGIKFAFYLKPVGAETGALRVIPGSHKQPYHDELRQARAESRLDLAEVPAFVCESEPGDVVAFDLRLWHASLGGGIDRPMCTLVYYNNPKTEEEDRVTREQAKSNADTSVKFGRPPEPIHTQYWLSNPNKNPRRQRWIERMRELEFFE